VSARTLAEKLDALAWQHAYRCDAHPEPYATLEAHAAARACRRCRREASSIRHAMADVVEACAVECERQQREEPECPERAQYCAASLRSSLHPHEGR
jgi:hypothetical protein